MQVHVYARIQCTRGNGNVKDGFITTFVRSHTRSAGFICRFHFSVFVCTFNAVALLFLLQRTGTISMYHGKALIMNTRRKYRVKCHPAYIGATQQMTIDRSNFFVPFQRFQLRVAFRQSSYSNMLIFFYCSSSLVITAFRFQ